MNKHLTLFLVLLSTGCAAAVEMPVPDAAVESDSGTEDASVEPDAAGPCDALYWAQGELECPEIPCLDAEGTAHPECVAACAEPTDTIFCNPDGAFCMNGSLSVCVPAS
jgi:hypothetical protein